MKALIGVILFLAGPILAILLVSRSFHLVMQGLWGTGFALVAAAFVLAFGLPYLGIKIGGKKD